MACVPQAKEAAQKTPPDDSSTLIPLTVQKDPRYTVKEIVQTYQTTSAKKISCYFITPIVYLKNKNLN